LAREFSNTRSRLPGYRIYFGKDGETLVILLLAGGTKQRQQRDINSALAYWRDYKRRK
jgi:putative addiction module killer protein